MKFSILGYNGFIGKNLIKYLQKNKLDYDTINLDDEFSDESLGHVIYAIGITSDFRTRPFDTVNSHVCRLMDFLKNVNFESFLYLSSTRIYSKSDYSYEEKPVVVNPLDFSDHYNLSKLMGESICLSSSKKNIRIARLSNVIGENFDSDDFLFSLIKDAVKNNQIILNSSSKSEKDYVHIDDVTKILINIATSGKNKIYNVASGKNIRTEEIVEKIIKSTGCKIKDDFNSKSFSFPLISIEKIVTEFGFVPVSALDKIEEIINEYKKNSENRKSVN